VTEESTVRCAAALLELTSNLLRLLAEGGRPHLLPEQIEAAAIQLAKMTKGGADRETVVETLTACLRALPDPTRLTEPNDRRLTYAETRITRGALRVIASRLERRPALESKAMSDVHLGARRLILPERF
jgi:hypothetical protein